VLPDERLRVAATPTPHPAIGATGAPVGWPAAGAGRTIAVVDTGVDPDHPALEGKVVASECFSSEGSFFDGDGMLVVIEPACAGGTPELLGAPCDVEGCEHGTAVAGVAAGRTSGTTNALGGVAPGADLAAVQVFSEITDQECPLTCSIAFTSDVLAALDWLATVAADLDLAAVNLSLGSYSPDMCANQYGAASVQALVGQGVPVIAAAGNEHDPNAVAWPACLSNTIAVAASHPSLGGWSVPETAVFNGGSKVAVAAPGLRVPAPVVGTTSWALFDGTSFAAPAVAGAAAAWRAKQPTAGLSQFLPSVTSGTVTDLRTKRKYARLWVPRLTSANRPALHRLERATVQGRTVVLQGWALDPDGAKPNVRLLVDGRPVKQLGPNVRRTEIASFFGGSVDTYSGWTHTAGVSAGKHRVCAQVADSGTSTWHSTTCSDVVVK
jgi:subtilisin family serine protease